MRPGSRTGYESDVRGSRNRDWRRAHQRAAAALLHQLEATRLEYGPGWAPIKLELLRALARCSMQSSGAVRRLHEHLCFLRAYPDNEAVLTMVRRLLRGFARRTDVRRHRRALIDSGIAGTDIRYAFFWATARRLAVRWPDRLGIDWDQFSDRERFLEALPVLVGPEQAARLGRSLRGLRRGLVRLAGGAGRDGAFIVRRVAAMPGDDFQREKFFDAIELPLVLRAGRDTPSRTAAEYRHSPVVFRREAPGRGRPDLLAELARPPRAVRKVSGREGRVLLALAQDAMATRARDLDAFAYGDERDVRLVDDGEGLQWIVNGMLPERRPKRKQTYGFLALRNGVPVSYLDAHFWSRSVDTSFNVFEAFRGGESAFIFARLLAAFRCLFGTRSFALAPYQLGRDNDEALESGAWWFYYKLGFRPKNRAILALAQWELARMRAQPGHRSSQRTLARLAADYLYLETGRSRAPDWARFNARNPS
jgi:hypothetical protein